MKIMHDSINISRMMNSKCASVADRALVIPLKIPKGFTKILRLGTTKIRPEELFQVDTL